MADLPDAGVGGAEDCCFTVAIIDRHPVIREAVAMLVDDSIKTTPTSIEYLVSILG
jgi:hypothetical protein